MGFEEQLRKSTVSKETLENNRKLRKHRNAQYMAEVFVKAFIMACKGAAKAGKHSLSFGIPFHNELRVGGMKRYANNESYIADCYHCASESASIFYPQGLFCPSDLQTFNAEDELACVLEQFSYPRSYADMLASEIEKELKNYGFTNARVFYHTGYNTTVRKFFKKKKVHVPFSKKGVEYFYMGIKTEW